MGPGMLYMVGKIFLQGVRFDIVYNEWFNENMELLGKLNFCDKVKQKISQY